MFLYTDHTKMGVHQSDSSCGFLSLMNYDRQSRTVYNFYFSLFLCHLQRQVFGVTKDLRSIIISLETQVNRQ